MLMSGVIISLGLRGSSWAFLEITKATSNQALITLDYSYGFSQTNHLLRFIRIYPWVGDIKILKFFIPSNFIDSVRKL